jgi:drug/metabolite transporter (DMT)-like permease
MLLIMVGAFVVGLSSVLDSTCDPSSDYPPPNPYPPRAEGTEGLTPDIGEPLVPLGRPSDSGPLWSALAPGRDTPCSDDDGSNATHPLLGNVFVIAAQAFSALQFVVEEKYVKQYRVPALLAVGLEGFWGLILCCLALPLFQNIQVRDLEDRQR